MVCGYTRHLHYWLSRIFNGIKKFLHMNYHTKDEVYQTYVIEAQLQKQFKSFINSLHPTLLIVVIVVINEIFYYLTQYFAMSFLVIGSDAHIDF
jgi:hypothetical protein